MNRIHSTQPEIKQTYSFSGLLCTNERKRGLIGSVPQKVPAAEPLGSVHRALEDQLGPALGGAQLGGTEGAGGVEGVGAVGQRDFRPVLDRLLRAHVSARHEGVSGRPRVHVEGGLAAQPQWDVGPHHPAHGAFSLGVGLPLGAVAPVVVAVDVAARQVDPRLLVLQRGEGPTALHAGEGEGVETHRALGASRVDLLPEGLQVLLGWSVEETLCSAPQQSGSAQIHQGAILQNVTLILHLRKKGSMLAFSRAG